MALMTEWILSCVDEREDIDIETQIEQTFRELDRDSSNTITTNELVKGMKLFGMNPTENECRFLKISGI